MSKARVSKAWFRTDAPGVLEPTDEALAAARAFVFERWKERAVERGAPEPSDLSSSCKFSSMFVRLVFGGRIRGNYDHQYALIAGRIIDLNADAADVREMDTPYRDDAAFLGSPDHLDSMVSCLARVERWAEAFLAAYTPAVDAETAAEADAEAACEAEAGSPSL